MTESKSHSLFARLFCWPQQRPILRWREALIGLFSAAVLWFGILVNASLVHWGYVDWPFTLAAMLKTPWFYLPVGLLTGLICRHWLSAVPLGLLAAYTMFRFVVV